MNWGKGLTLALIAFAGMMAWFVFKASQNGGLIDIAWKNTDVRECVLQNWGTNYE